MSEEVPGPPPPSIPGECAGNQHDAVDDVMAALRIADACSIEAKVSAPPPTPPIVKKNTMNIVMKSDTGAGSALSLIRELKSSVAAASSDSFGDIGVSSTGAVLSAVDAADEVTMMELGEDDEDDEDEKDVDPLEPVRGEVRCVPSLYPHRVPGIYFDYPECLRNIGIVRDEQGPGADFYIEELGSRKIFYKCNWERNCIKNAFNRAGFRRKISGVQWNCAWTKHLSTEGFQSLNRFQKANHFPGSWCIGRKDRLMRCISRAKRALGSGLPSDAYDIVPGGWILPAEYGSFLRASNAQRNPVYIMKPCASACGRGIKLIHKNNMNAVPKDKPCIMQDYLKDPYLINGKKFDLRIYVLVTSFDPLRSYVFQEGLARFSTHNYSMKKLNSRFAHLTNYSVNKKSKHFVAPTSETNSDMEGSKWSLTALWRYLVQAEGRSKVKKCQKEVRRLIAKTLIAAEAEIAPQIHRYVKHPGICYELFGFDVFLDKSLRPWLIEVNISPSLMGSSPLDQKIKGTLMADTFHLIGNVPYDERALKTDALKEKMLRRSGSYRSKTSCKRTKQDLWRKNPAHPGTVSFHHLDDEDWELIHDAEDEFARRGHFSRLFPSEENVDLLNYFQSPRFNNTLMFAWLLYGRPSYVRSMHIIDEAGNGENSKAYESLVKVAQKKNRIAIAEGRKTVSARPPFDTRGDAGGGGWGVTALAGAELAAEAVLVPGFNCAASRCPLPTVEDDDCSWLVPLGTQSKEQVKRELAQLASCSSGPAPADAGSDDLRSLESSSSGRDSNAENKGSNTNTATNASANASASIRSDANTDDKPARTERTSGSGRSCGGSKKTGSGISKKGKGVGTVLPKPPKSARGKGSGKARQKSEGKKIKH